MAKAKLSARQQLEIRKATRRREVDPSERPGELNIVPFLDVVVNLMLFLLATSAAAAALAQAEAELPSTCHGPGCGERPPGLELSVTVTSDGVYVAGRGGRLAPGCRDTTTASGPTVPRTARGHDLAALERCAAHIAERFPDEREVILSAEPQVPYEDLIGVMDATRPSFPEVRLSAGVR